MIYITYITLYQRHPIIYVYVLLTYIHICTVGITYIGITVLADGGSTLY